MKIEKIAENKIRIVIKQEDLKDPSLDLHTIMTKAVESHGLILEILNKAKKECGFDTEGYKLLIEAFSSQDEVMVFTITKYKVEKILDSAPCAHPTYPKRLAVKRKIDHLSQTNFSIYRFSDFEQFCSFCSSLKLHRQISMRGLVHSSSLYAYNGNFFLVLSGIQSQHKSFVPFYTLLSEFSIFCTHATNFENRLKEYGKCVMQKNAFATTIKFFVH